MIKGLNPLSLFLSSRDIHKLRKKDQYLNKSAEVRCLPFPLTCPNKNGGWKHSTFWVDRKPCQWRIFKECDKERPRHNIKQVQWLCILSGRHFEDTFEETQRRKAKQMQPMRLCIRDETLLLIYRRFIGRPYIAIYRIHSADLDHAYFCIYCSRVSHVQREKI